MNAKTAFAVWVAAVTGFVVPAAHAYNVSAGYTFDPDTAHCIENAVRRYNERAVCGSDPSTRHDAAMQINQWLSKVSVDVGKLNVTPLQADRIHNPHRIPERVYRRW